MSVRIRLRRVGRKKQPYWRVVVVPRGAPRDGAYIEEIGFYNPRTRPASLTLDLVKLDEWIQNGAEVSDSVKSLARKARKGGDDDVVYTRPGEEAPRLKTAKKPERRPKSTAAGMETTDEAGQPAAERSEPAPEGVGAPEAEQEGGAEVQAEEAEETEGKAEVKAAVETAEPAAEEEATEAQEEAETESEATEASATEVEESGAEAEEEEKAEAGEEAEAAAEEETEAEAAEEEAEEDEKK